MATIIRKLGSVSFYTKFYQDTVNRADNYYRPLIHKGSIVPLFHFMTATSTMFYVVHYYFKHRPKILAKQKVEAKALKQYCEKYNIHLDH